MKFCSNCGSALNEGADICLTCGRFVQKSVSVKQSNTGKTLGIISLFVWVVPLAGWIVGGIGMSKSLDKKSKTLNVIGIVLATAMALFNLITIIINM